MEDIYTQFIDEDIYKKIIEGRCTFLVCVNDKTVQSYKEGNFLTFAKRDSEDKLQVKILRFLYFPTIKELFNMVNKQKCGYRAGANIDSIEDEYTNLYKANKIDKFGVVAIEFELSK